VRRLEDDPAGVSSKLDACRTDWGCFMNTQLLIVIMSIVALHVAALLGGGMALGVMRLLGRKTPSLAPGDATDTVH
jgi:hypothetical protein